MFYYKDTVTGSCLFKFFKHLKWISSTINSFINSIKFLLNFLFLFLVLLNLLNRTAYGMFGQPIGNKAGV